MAGHCEQCGAPAAFRADPDLWFCERCKEGDYMGFPDVDVILDAVRRSNLGCENPGFCRACGEEASGCEPDARNYKCESCGACEVFGAEEALIMVM